MSLAGISARSSTAIHAGRAAGPASQEEPESDHRTDDDAADEHHVGVTQHPPVRGFARGRAIAGGLFQLGESLVDQVEAEVGLSRVLARRSLARARELHGLRGGHVLAQARPLRDPLDDVAVFVAGGKGHAVVIARRILAERRLHDALPLHEGSPVAQGDRPQTRDAVGHRDVRQRQPLGGARGGILGVERLVGDPALEPQQRREGAAREPELVQESRDEDGGEGRRVGDEVVERAAERIGAPLAGGRVRARPTGRPIRSRRDAAPCAAPSGGHSRSGRAGASPAPPTARRSRGGTRAGTRSTKRSTFSRSMRPSVCEISVIASSYTRG